MAEISVGSATWRDASYKTIFLAKDLRIRPFSCLPPNASTKDKMRSEGEKTQMKSIRREHPTPPPFNRDLIIDTCNTYARGYMRETRTSMSILRQALCEMNHHIHRLQKQRSTLERSHVNTRRDILTNNETTHLRSTRPMSERYPDKVDHLLQEEKKGLHDLKRHSENQLHQISRQLQVLYSHRQKLLDSCKEKGRVLDIIGENARCREQVGGNKLLGPENTDCQVAIGNALVTSEKFRNTQPPNWQKPEDRRELKETVTQALCKKAEESARIWEDLTLTSGDVKNMMQRQQRIHDEMEAGYQLQLGPVSSLDLSTRERLDRPLVRVLQRHPGTQLPESTLIIQGTASLQKSLDKNRDRIGLLHYTQSTLKNDQENKLRGESIDREAARLRARSAKGRRERLCL
ncbi:coiled-coil domain-containing protein 105 [Bufo bufo]|uniref:coiled-coil domain-containing protein 105 n=1 Tax=Bufo bufo TaxID=8384 RepID=UPI001ABE5F9E|nr:coiled-coil domain-containing protein 105 [Bufo bufo]XP_040261182.1 coiled-coil domain-containing protein 105 [Bufo bufo]XP_040261183.1 coiled-coil domain-containing protein 105 [Bufo bufo]